MAPIANIRDNNTATATATETATSATAVQRIAFKAQHPIREAYPSAPWTEGQAAAEWSEFATPFHPHAMCKSHTVAKNFDSYLRLAQKIRDMTCAEWSRGSGIGAWAGDGDWVWEWEWVWVWGFVDGRSD